MKDTITYIGLDVHKDSICVALCNDDAVERYFGQIANTPMAVRKLAGKLATKADRLCFCYEAGPCGYGIYRQLVELGHECMVVAPSLIPRKPGERVKTDRRDALMLTRLHKMGALTSVWVPDEAHEAMRDLVRARASAVHALRRARQHLSGFLLRHGRTYHGRKAWTLPHRRWLSELKFDHPAQQIVFQDYVHAVEDGEARRNALEQHIKALVPQWSLAPLVAALQSMRGVALIVAVTVVAEVGDLHRFDHPRQLMGYLGLVPCEYSSGPKRRLGAITKAGNTAARRVLIEGAWSYRSPARITRERLRRMEGLPKQIRDIAWKAEVR
ncbi:MAG: IS110 family transposase, partial [Gammaproteobacteria bacterium]|nr:IS110 family transposase [Gammaproteobacteria bacterium]